MIEGGVLVEIFYWLIMIVSKGDLPKRGSIYYKGTAWMRILGVYDSNKKVQKGNRKYDELRHIAVPDPDTDKEPLECVRLTCLFLISVQALFGWLTNIGPLN